ncbi:MAG: sulfotransferase family protein [Phycisphaerales bacterium JB065]
MARDDPFFIIGTGRCGTTLLQAMLMCHPRVTIPPETHFYSRFHPAAHGLRCPVVDEEVEAYLEKVVTQWWWEQLGLDGDGFAEAVRSGEARTSRELMLWVLDHLAMNMGEAEPASLLIGEKTPHFERYIDAILGDFPGAKFIHMYRDPRDVVVSLQKEWWWREPSKWRTAVYWRDVMERQAKAAEALGPAKYLELRYETLVDRPEEELKRICAFLGVEFDESMLRHHERKASGFLEVEKSWKQLTMKPIDKARHGRYRSKLSPQEIRRIERTAGPMLKRFGYGPDETIGDSPLWRLSDLGDWARWQAGKLKRSVQKRLGRYEPFTLEKHAPKDGAGEKEVPGAREDIASN